MTEPTQTAIDFVAEVARLEAEYEAAAENGDKHLRPSLERQAKAIRKGKLIGGMWQPDPSGMPKRGLIIGVRPGEDGGDVLVVQGHPMAVSFDSAEPEAILTEIEALLVEVAEVLALRRVARKMMGEGRL